MTDDCPAFDGPQSVKHGDEQDGQAVIVVIGVGGMQLQPSDGGRDVHQATVQISDPTATRWPFAPGDCGLVIHSGWNFLTLPMGTSSYWRVVVH